jgi:two-component system, OmpR family, phosphate regulon sensor histidine kinase PhoR
LIVLKARFAARLFNTTPRCDGLEEPHPREQGDQATMINRRMAVAFCPSDHCISGAPDANNTGTVEVEGKSRRLDLLGAVDFYASILAMATHDLRQPLQVIISALELLARRITEKPEREHLDRGAEASAQLTEKLEQLTDALHLYRGSGRIEPQPVRVKPIFDRLGLQLNGLAQRKGIDFRALPTRTVIMSQPVLLDGILRNLARNALDHTSAGGRVLVGCRRRAATVRIEVHDTGEGIPQDELQSIFEPFFRIDTARSEGLGLGLFIVRQAADCLGHWVEVRSTIGHGSCFSVVARTASFDQGQ